MITDDMPISVGNLKALIPQIVARGGAFAEGYWKGTINNVITYNVWNYKPPQSVTISIGKGVLESEHGIRIYKTGSSLVFVDAGKYAITATMSITSDYDDDFDSLDSAVMFGDIAALSFNSFFSERIVSSEFVVPTNNFVGEIELSMFGHFVGGTPVNSVRQVSWLIKNISITRIE